MSENSKSLKSFAEYLFEHYEDKHNYRDQDEFTSAMTKRYKEVAESIDISSEFLKNGRGYSIFKEDEEFIIKIILDDFDSNSNMLNIRKGNFDKVDHEYIETIIEGFKNILTKNNIKPEELDLLIIKMKKNTKIEVREKCLEVENIIKNILEEVQSYRNDSNDLLGNTQDIINELEHLKEDVINIYDKFISGGYSSYKFDLKLIGEIHAINEKEKKALGEEEFNRRIKIESLTNHMYFQSDEYKKIKSKIEELFNSTNFKVNRDRELKKLHREGNALRNSMKQLILDMTDEEREELNKKQKDDIWNIILDNK
ncbi:OmpH family outer membrane protein [Clostridium saccharoperbutylacetonicum]|uniref:OmpH family outer membrane protein n=1 Tax=Clostridium saccharoperbutylacetonicum TaxID=36745 RepID=UPI000983E548|nr:OmpH family outer membrane protein [Clostridium saccharoperbutylacetonicum]AQR93095.1 hypothetical protein CLSAP_03700 [Clostridium saccharoperbutylacetonicum]NSB34506.1 hypothetical protein [Clostridium saccharoperbutylacetonicum]